MFENPFYNESTRRMVSVFGSLFNDIKVIKRNAAGDHLQTIKVPLAYGPRQKFLARLTEKSRDPKMALKLPRISFEITDMLYDGAAKLNKHKKFAHVVAGDPKNRDSLGAPAVYKVNFELNILSKTQDEALQILEQILPIFQPEYTVTIKDIPEMELTSDVPIILTAVSLNDEYEGDLIERRSIVYTLNFETRIRYYKGLYRRSIIEKTGVKYIDGDTLEPIEVQKIDGTTTPYTETIDFFNEP
jgi:hypothetical protein